MSDEMNPAEAEAERILQEAFDASQDADCPLGEDCPVHFRVDEEVMDDYSQYGRLINYVGDYVVVTTDNPEIESPVTLLKILMGKIGKDDLPDLYETAVIYVGEGALMDVQGLDVKGQRAAVRFLQKHTEWSNFKAAHEAVVGGLRDGIIDVSSSAYEDK